MQHNTICYDTMQHDMVQYNMKKTLFWDISYSITWGMADLDIAYPSKTQECILHMTRIAQIHIQCNVLSEGQK